MARVIDEARPTWVLGENVAGLVTMGIDNVLSDLEGMGYAVQTFIVPACAVDAPHRRDRIWIVGNAEHDGSQDGCEETGRKVRQGKQGGCANLREQVVHPKMWPTPTAMEHVDGGTNFKSLAKGDKGGRILRRIATLTLAGKIPDPRTADQEKLLPTPCTRDWKGASGRAYKGEAIDLPSVVGGSLNPTWVEWLMGYPIGWTDSRDLGTQSCPKSPTSSSD